jgi:hypothetical protein
MGGSNIFKVTSTSCRGTSCAVVVRHACPFTLDLPSHICMDGYSECVTDLYVSGQMKFVRPNTAHTPCQLIDSWYACPLACPASTNSFDGPKSRFDIDGAALGSFVSKTDLDNLHWQAIAVHESRSSSSTLSISLSCVCFSIAYSGGARDARIPRGR